MKNSKKILVTSATSEIFIIRRGNRQQTARRFCESCATETEMLDLSLAVTIFQIGMRELMRRVEAGAVHSIETKGGHLLVCAESLEAEIKKTNQIKQIGEKK